MLERKAPALRKRSRQILAAHCFQAHAAIKPSANNLYGRTVGRVECNRWDVSLRPVRSGMIWWHVKYGKDSAIHNA